MSDKDLSRVLRRMAVETGSLVCLGCGHEHNCGVHGCAIINEAAARLESIAEPPNDPLTLDELREMDGEPVWIERVGDNSHIDSNWAFVIRENCLCKTADRCVAFFELYGKAWLAYRRKPEEAERDALKEKFDGIIHCRDCKHLYAKDMSAYCPHRVGPCSPDGFCDRGARGE